MVQHRARSEEQASLHGQRAEGGLSIYHPGMPARALRPGGRVALFSRFLKLRVREELHRLHLGRRRFRLQMVNPGAQFLRHRQALLVELSLIHI